MFIMAESGNRRRDGKKEEGAELLKRATRGRERERAEVMG
jgi:hypothetical protein